MYRNPTPQEDTVQELAIAIRQKVEAIVKMDFEGWSGEIRTRLGTLKVDMDWEPNE